MSSTELLLMQKIKTLYGAKISAACQESPIPPAFVAGLVANESNGIPGITRFEPSVLVNLWDVVIARKSGYGSITRAVLVGFIADLRGPGDLPDPIPRKLLYNLDDLAKSWGLSQIMGYRCLEKAPIFLRPEDLQDPDTSIQATILALGQFAHEFSLDLAGDFESLARCWNTGRPDGKTFDPLYVQNCVSRMEIYETLP